MCGRSSAAPLSWSFILTGSLKSKQVSSSRREDASGSGSGSTASMLSRKGSSAGMKGSSPVMGAGADRSRVGERLRAALAGLQELHLLKDRQGDMVSWALRMDREEPVSAGLPDPTGAEEQRLEATLTTLKQQLVGSREVLCVHLFMRVTLLHRGSSVTFYLLLSWE